MGQGTYTILAQTAAEVLGVPVEHVVGEAGRFARCRARRVAGGSQLANLMTGRRAQGARAARDELIGLALNDPNSPFHALQAEHLVVANGRIASPRGDGPDFDRRPARQRSDATRSRSMGDTLPDNATRGSLQELHHHRHACCAPTDGDFPATAGARISSRSGSMRTSARSAYRAWCPRWIAAGSTTRSSPKASGRAASSWASARRCWRKASSTARNGRIVNNNLADYLIATNADIPDIEVISVGIPDPHASALGGKGVGELGSSAWRPRSPMPCSTPPASASAICRSRSRS